MAELAGLPTPSMDWHSPDAPQAFKKFKARCELYFSGPLKEKSEEEQVSYLLIWSGDDGIELVSTWALTAHTVDCFANYYNKKVEKFFSRFWNPNSSGVDFFVQNVRNENCLVVPPVTMITKAIHYLYASRRAIRTVIVPFLAIGLFLASYHKQVSGLRDWFMKRLKESGRYGMTGTKIHC